MKILFFSALFIAGMFLHAQEKQLLWKDTNPPFQKENTLQEYEEILWGTRCIKNISIPELYIYPAKGENSHAAVIICPGGGYELEAIEHEGHEVAEILSKNGVTAVVLKYRLPLQEISDQPQRLPLTDLQRALELMRKQAGKYDINPKKIGVMGFSAGAHLSAYACSKELQTPNFALLIYGCPLLGKENIQWLEDKLFHREMTTEEFKELNLLELIHQDHPPCFFVHSLDDETCHYTETTVFAQKLRDYAVPTEVHLFPTGGHGFGLGKPEDGTNQWMTLAINWIKRL